MLLQLEDVGDLPSWAKSRLNVITESHSEVQLSPAADLPNWAQVSSDTGPILVSGGESEEVASLTPHVSQSSIQNVLKMSDNQAADDTSRKAVSADGVVKPMTSAHVSVTSKQGFLFPQHANGSCRPATWSTVFHKSHACLPQALAS